MCSVNLKLDQLEAELQDLNSQESKDEASLAKVFVLLSVPLKATSFNIPFNVFLYPPLFSSGEEADA